MDRINLEIEGDYSHLNREQEALVNPIAAMMRNFVYDRDNPEPPYHEKTSELKREFPEHIKLLLSIEQKIEDLGAMDKARKGIQNDEVDRQHSVLKMQQIALMKAMAIKKFGSVDKFMEWWLSD